MSTLYFKANQYQLRKMQRMGFGLGMKPGKHEPSVALVQHSANWATKGIAERLAESFVLTTVIKLQSKGYI